MHTTKDEEDRRIVSLTVASKGSRQGQVTNFGLFEITDLELVRIDAKIKSVLCIQPRKDRPHKSTFNLDV